MQIKWRDRSNGIGVYEHWVRISQARALEMLKRNAPREYDIRLFRLSCGDEIETETYVLRGEEHDKFDI